MLKLDHMIERLLSRETSLENHCNNTRERWRGPSPDPGIVTLKKSLLV